MLIWKKPALGTLIRWCCVVLAVCGVQPGAVLAADFASRLAAGEIVVHSVDVPGSTIKKGEATGMVAAPPAKVWEVVTDANNFREFLPRMISSRLVRFGELKRILQERPASAAGVEALLDPAPPGLALFRIPGREYLGYFYGHLQVPWPLRDRWYIVRVVWNESQAPRQIYTCSWSLMIGNLREYRGEWRVEPFQGNRTQLTYRVLTDPGGFVPKFLVEEFSTKTLPQVIEGVRRRVASPYRSELPN